MEELLEVLYEMVEHTGYVSKLLVSSEIAMNDGEIAECQKYTKEAQTLLGTMIGDVFVEFAEACEVENDEVNDYDIPTSLELVKQLNDIQYNIGVLLGLIADEQNEQILKTCEIKIKKATNTIIEIYNSIYNN